MTAQRRNNQFAELPENQTEPLCRRRIVLTVTGGIAAYKSCFLTREIARRGGEVQVIMTRAAEEFVKPLTFATLSGNPVLDELFPINAPASPVHLQAPKWGELLVIAPATANFIGKLANGLADDCASASALAFQGPILIAPAMNPAMWSNPAVQANVALLKKRGYNFIGPEAGEMGGIDENAGIGRMSEPDAILFRMEELLCTTETWKDRKVIVTSGPTREPIDPVRFIGNRSSGVMGDTLARRACLKGAEVTLIRGRAALGKAPDGVNVVVVDSAAEMAGAVKSRFETADVLIMAAAVADWTVADPAEKKLKKIAGSPQFQWKETEDILEWAGRNKSHQVVVGFALETDNHEQAAQKKLQAKNADIIALNDPTLPHSRFGGSTTQLMLLRPGMALIELPVSTKAEAADELLMLVEPLLKPR